MSSTPPTSLLTPDAASGRELARLLATQLPATTADTGSMASYLRTSARGIDAELAEALYFHAIALANQGWKGATGSSRI